MTEISPELREELHHLAHLAEVLDKGWPGIAEWNRDVDARRGETYRELRKRLRDGK